MATVYIIKNTRDDRVYIGSTRQPLHRRLNEHRSRARKGNKRYFLYEVMREIGVENFYISSLREDVEESELLTVEQECIKTYPDKDKLLNTKYGISYTDIEYIIEAYSRGMKIKQIAATRHHDAKNVSRILKENGVAVLDWNEHQRIKITDDELYRLYVLEMNTTVEIAQMYNTSALTINKHLKKAKIPLRRAVNRKYLDAAPAGNGGVNNPGIKREG